MSFSSKLAFLELSIVNNRYSLAFFYAMFEPQVCFEICLQKKGHQMDFID